MNRAFWAAELAVAERRMKDPAILLQATSAMAAERDRRLPIEWQISLYGALQDAEAAKRRFAAQQSRRAGSAKKTDPLQAFIVEAVKSNGSITHVQLLDKLRREQQPGGWVEDVDDKTIWFVDAKGLLKEAPASGLKDRLSRAKKSLGRDKKISSR
nr:hypothetical protein [Methylocapsa sp. RX1]